MYSNNHDGNNDDDAGDYDYDDEDDNNDFNDSVLDKDDLIMNELYID